MKNTEILKNNGIDLESSLELFGDIETYNETVIDFLETLTEKLENIEKYKTSSDMKNYSIVVHSLKSDARYLGIKSLAEIAYKHEIESKDNNINFIYDDNENLLKEIDKIVILLRRYIGEEAPAIKIQKTVSKPKTNKKILVVDDSDIIRNYIVKMFSDEYIIESSIDGEEAIKTISFAEEGSIVGMLLDLNMPNINGFEVLEYMHKNNLFIKVPVAIITGDDSKDALSKTTHYPIVDVIQKPFNERDIKLIIDKMVK